MQEVRSQGSSSRLQVPNRMGQASTAESLSSPKACPHQNQGVRVSGGRSCLQFIFPPTSWLP